MESFKTGKSRLQHENTENSLEKDLMSAPPRKTLKYDIREEDSSTDEKSFSCDICSAVFPREKYLTKHMITHTGEKPFKCEICQYACFDSGVMKRHRQHHSGEKSFK